MRRWIVISLLLAVASLPIAPASLDARVVATQTPAPILSSVPNFRELGGLQTTDGRKVRKGLLFRSDQLDKVTDADLISLWKLKLATIVDLRTDAERSAGQDMVPKGTRHITLDVLGNQREPAAIMKEVMTRGGVPVMIDIYRDLAGTAQADAAYKSLLAELLHAKGPTLFHCTAGKDRTGWGAALILSLLGVPRETVIADFLVSNERLVAKNERIYAAVPSIPRAALEEVMTVRRDYIEAAFAEADRRYGSFDVYAQEALGMDAKAIKRLRKHYLAKR
jgi:protein-tyrosine phosphatase